MKVSGVEMELHYNKNDNQFYFKKVEDKPEYTPREEFFKDYIYDYWLCVKNSCGTEKADYWLTVIRDAHSMLMSRDVVISVIYDQLVEYHEYAFSDKITEALDLEYLKKLNRSVEDFNKMFWATFKEALQAQLIVIFNATETPQASISKIIKLDELTRRWDTFNNDCRGLVFTVGKKNNDNTMKIMTHLCNIQMNGSTSEFTTGCVYITASFNRSEGLRKTIIDQDPNVPGGFVDLMIQSIQGNGLYGIGNANLLAEAISDGTITIETFGLSMDDAGNILKNGF